MLLLFFVGCAGAQSYAPDSPYVNRTKGFRGSPWGSSERAVITTEPFVLLSRDSVRVVYKGEVLSFPATVVYRFYQGKLYGGSIHFQEEHSNPNLYIDDYRYIQKHLVTLYADPERDGMYWSNDLFRVHEQHYGMAVAAGYLTYMSLWTFMPGEIDLSLSGDNYKVALYFWIENRQFAPPKERATTKDF